MESSGLHGVVSEINALCTILHFILNDMKASMNDMKASMIGSTETEELYAILEKELKYDIDTCYARAYNACRAFCRILEDRAKKKYVNSDDKDFKKSCDNVNEIKGYEKREWTVSVDSILRLLEILQSATEEHQEACARIKMSDGKALGEVTLVFTPKRKRHSLDEGTWFDEATRTQHLYGGVYSWTEEAIGRINGKTYDEMLEIILREFKQLQERIPDFPQEL